ncbi:MAG: VapC toxin family PIN domain ribonuclease, partial [Cyanobacteria bacterium J06635_15]
LMRQRGMTDALTTDRHFEQEGFVRLLPPPS